MKLTLNKKLVGGFLLVAIIGLVIGLVGLFGLHESRKALTDIRGEISDRGQFLVQATDLARLAQVNFKIQVQEWKNTLLRGHDRTQFDKYWMSFAAYEQRVQENLQGLVTLLETYDVPSGQVADAAKTHLRLGESYRSAIANFDREDSLTHRSIDALVKGVDRAPTDEIDAIVDMVHSFEAAAAEEREAAFRKEAAQLSAVTLVAMLVGVGGAIGLGLWIGRSLSRQIKKIAQSLRHGAAVVDSAAAEVSRYGQSLADSTNRDAASIQEAGASLEVLSQSTRENAKTAQTATDIANQTRNAVKDGKLHMNEMERAMNAIRESGDGISQILKSIEEIAFQTNILALNAAVEAARAGEAGSGFAVVADEVRNLAQRSAKAAKETSSRIEDSIDKSRRGVEISSKVSRSLDEILSKAAELDELVMAIARSVEQNSEGVDQVNSAIRQIENSFQSNAAVTEESAAAAQELSEQALSLNRSVRDLSVLVGDSRWLQSAASGSNGDGSPVWRRAVESKAKDSKRQPLERGQAEAVIWN